MAKTDLLKTENFCMMPWVHLHVWPAGTAFPCCMADPSRPIGNTQKQNLEQIWNGSAMKNLRSRMLENRPSPECKRCYELEKSGLRTLRNHSNENFKHHFHQVEKTDIYGKADKVNLAYLDIRFSNLCNLRCRSCGPQFSSSWYQDHLKLNGSIDHPQMLKVHENMSDFFEDLRPHLLSVEEVYFAGGEPLITEEHYKVLDFWIENKKTDIRLGYTTNFTQMKYKGISIFDYWNQFKQVRVAASLDANHLRGEYLRKNLKWDSVLQNRKEMIKNCPHVYFEITPTVSIYNVLNLPDFHREWVELGLISPEQIRINLLLEPNYMRLQVLPEFLKQQVLQKYLAHLDWLESLKSVKIEKIKKDFQSVINFLAEKDHSELLSHWLSETKKVDSIRNEDVFKIFPELKELSID